MNQVSAAVSDRFPPEAASAVGPRSDRVARAEAAASMSLPSAEAEEWRYSPIGELALADLRPASEPNQVPDGLVELGPPASAERSATVVVVDGFVASIAVDDGWAAKGLSIVADEGLSPSLTADLDSPTIFDHLQRAFSPAAVVVEAPDGLQVDAPIVVVTYHLTADAVSFPHLIVRAGANAAVSVVEYQASAAAGVAVPVVELVAADASQLRYTVIQQHGTEHWQLGRQLATVGAQATLRSGAAAFGSRYARTRFDSRLLGRGASTELSAAYYGDGDQVLDFRVFQHHEARDTRSDLLFKGSQDDRSGSVYTGLIHIHPDGAGSNAFQTNRNIKLSDDAWAWSVPNLEIENNDVHCSHASTVSPVDTDQRFYLHARGVQPTQADRLIVAGFYQEVIDRLPVVAARDEVRRLIDEKLDRRVNADGR